MKQLRVLLKKLVSTKTRIIILSFMLLYIGVYIYGVYRPLPHEDLSFQGEKISIERPTFLYDISYEKDGQQVSEQQIFDHIYKMIDEAEEFLIVDMFLFHDVYDKGDSFPPLTAELTEAIINKKETNPEIDIVVMTDPVNSMYEAYKPLHFSELESAGVTVIISELSSLRDSNPIYSAGWRIFLRWFGYLDWNPLPHPQGSNGPNVTINSYLTALNGKANHRKVVLTENEAIVSSENPHDASAYHNNVAFSVTGQIIEDLLRTEQAVSTYSAQLDLPKIESKGKVDSMITGQVLTEGKIREQALSILSETTDKDTIWIGLLYLSERDVITELLEATNRGTEINIILDQNMESFGQEKTGLPNKPVAEELINKSNGKINIRWYETGKEQYHPKILFIDGEQTSKMLSGSANFTRRNLRDLTLETSLLIEAPHSDPVSNDVREYFERIWNNNDGIYTSDYEKYKDDSLWIKTVYTIQRFTNTSTY